MQNSKNLIKTVLVVLCVGILLVGAVVLPPVLASVGNHSLTKEVHLIPAEESLSVSNEELSIVGKLDLLENAVEDDFVFLEAGKHMDRSTMFASAEAGIQQLVDAGILPEGEVNWGSDTDHTPVYFILKPDHPRDNMIVWLPYFQIGELDGVLCIDDETGLVLQCIVRGEGVVDTTVPLEDWLTAWGEYLGITYEEDAVLPGEVWSRTFQQNGEEVKISISRGANSFTFGYNAQLYRFGTTSTISVSP